MPALHSDHYCTQARLHCFRLMEVAHLCFSESVGEWKEQIYMHYLHTHAKSYTIELANRGVVLL